MGCDLQGFGTDFFDEALFPAAPDADRVLAALGAAMLDLQRFEQAAQSLSLTPYR